MKLRSASAAVFLIGLIVGSASDRRPQRQPVRVDGYWILAADFHVHAFPGDGALAPWELRDEAARAGLDVIAVTDHNQVIAGRVASWVAEWFPDGPLLIPGEEVTTPAYHLVAIGVDDRIDPHQPSASAIADVHAQGGVAIAAHPAGRYVGYDSAALTTLDGAEAAHVAEDPAWAKAFVDFWRRARQMNPHAAAIGSSDFHASPAIGSCRTYVFARAVTAAGVLEAIRHGRTVSSDPDGRLQGDPGLVALVERARPAGRSDPHPGWRRASVALAWIGIVGVLVFRDSGGAIPVWQRAASLTKLATRCQTTRETASIALQVAAIRNDLAGDDVHVESHRDEPVGLQFDVVSPWRERQRLRRCGEVLHDAFVLAVNIDGGIRGRDVEAHASDRARRHGARGLCRVRGRRILRRRV